MLTVGMRLSRIVDLDGRIYDQWKNKLPTRDPLDWQLFLFWKGVTLKVVLSPYLNHQIPGGELSVFRSWHYSYFWCFQTILLLIS